MLRVHLMRPRIDASKTLVNSSSDKKTTVIMFPYKCNILTEEYEWRFDMLRYGNSSHYKPNCPCKPPINPDRLISNNRGTVGTIDPAMLKAESDIDNLEGMGNIDTTSENS